MSRIRALVGLAALAGATTWIVAASAGAANRPAFRDCSLIGGTDPDFVQLSGVSVSPEGALTVMRGQTTVGIEASESTDPGDNLGNDTLRVKVSSKRMRRVFTTEVSGTGTGKVNLAIPLSRSRKVGRTYTISWEATFDNGNHACPSGMTPENTSPRPFVVTVHG